MIVTFLKHGDGAVADERAAGPIDRRLGARVRTRRREIGMTQENLAELLGVTFQQVQKYEKGLNRISVGRLHAMAIALNVPVHRFFEGLSPKSRKVGDDPNTLEEVLLTPGATELMHLYKKIPSAKGRKLALDLVRVLSEERK